MMPLEVRLTLVAVASRLNDLAIWLWHNADDLSEETTMFMAAYMMAMAQYANTVLDVTDNPRRQVIAGRRCIFY